MDRPTIIGSGGTYMPSSVERCSMLNADKRCETSTTLGRAYNTFPGTIDPSEYRSYILVMLPKYFSDVSLDPWECFRVGYLGGEERGVRPCQGN